MIFEIKGKPTKVSIQELRALLHATKTILTFHNQSLITPSDVIKITLVKKLPAEYEGFVGFANSLMNEITMLDSFEFSEMATVVIHEIIHLYFDFNEIEQEKLTSTLTAKIKGDVVRMANILAENTQQRAAYIAHTKIAYKPSGSDFYDQSQYHANHEQSTGKKYRKQAVCS